MNSPVASSCGDSLPLKGGIGATHVVISCEDGEDAYRG